MKFIEENGTLKTHEIAKKLKERFDTLKKIGPEKVTVEDIEKVLNTIFDVNNLDEFETCYCGRQLVDYQVIACFKPFLAPKKVTLLSPFVRCPDLRMTYKVDEKKLANMGELKTISDAIANSMKTVDYGTFNLGERDYALLSDLKVAAINARKQSYVQLDNDSYFVPVPIKKIVNAAVGTHIYNEDADYVLTQYLNNFTFV